MQIQSELEMIPLRTLAAALCLWAAPALACDMVPPPEVTNDFREKVPGWMVWKFTPQARAEGHMLTGHFKRRTFPPAGQEKAFIEGEVGKAVTALYRSQPSAVGLQGASAPVPRESMRFRTEARAFTLSLDFAGTRLTAPGYMRINKNRKDIALIVAIVDPSQAARAAQIARQTMEHPGFDCTAGDSP